MDLVKSLACFWLQLPLVQFFAPFSTWYSEEGNGDSTCGNSPAVQSVRPLVHSCRLMLLQLFSRREQFYMIDNQTLLPNFFPVNMIMQKPVEDNSVSLNFLLCSGKVNISDIS